MRRFFTVAVLLFLAAPLSFAQDYRFSVPEANVAVVIEPGGDAVVHYQLKFSCARGAHPIDVVDIGMPNMGKHEAISAAIRGKRISGGNIRISTYLKPKGSGYEVHLGSNTIQPGAVGTFEFTAREQAMVWQDTTNPEQASFRFSPTWFGPQYVNGVTKLNVQVVLPIPASDLEAVQDDIRWQAKGQEFTFKGVLEGEELVSVGWTRDVSLTRPHMFAVSFPKKYVSHVRRDTIFSVFFRWFKGSPEGQIISGIVVIILLAVAFFRFTGQTGCGLFVLLAAGLGVAMYMSPVAHLCLYPAALLLIVAAYLWRARARRRYFPAELTVEGGGIARGLTAVEAAVLLEEPLSKVLTMIIFGLAQKGMIEITNREPLHITVTGKRRSKGVWLDDRGEITKIWPYEGDFLHEFKQTQYVTVETANLTAPFERLFRRVVKKMNGFNLKETRDYYRYLVQRAWYRVETEADYEARGAQVDKHLPWLMLDEEWQDRLRNREEDRFHYRPHWWYRGHYPHHTHPPAAPSVPSSGPGVSEPVTSFTDVANSLAGRFETTANNLISNLKAVSKTAKGGIDLSSIDHAVSEFVSKLGEGGDGGGGWSGGGGGCACACAGCACACACAGGGR